MQRDDRVYLGHMLDMARKATGKVAGKSRSDYDADEDLRMVVAHLVQTIGETAAPMARQMRTPLFLAFLTAACLLLAGCGKGGDAGQLALEGARLSAEDVTKVLGIGVHKFKVHPSRDVSASVVFWVEEYVPSEGGPETHDYELGRWWPADLSGDLLFMLPEKSARKCYFGVGGSGGTSGLPDSVELDGATGMYTRVPERIEFQFGEEAILAVQIQSHETTGASAAGMQEYVDENVRLGKYERILVYKVRFTPMGSEGGTE